MLRAITSCMDLFSILQKAFRHEDKSRNRLRLSSTLHGFLDNFRLLAKDLVSRPTHIAELVPDREPVTNGVCDTATLGMCGVHFVPADTMEIPILWRRQFPDRICQHLSSFVNSNGSITNSNLCRTSRFYRTQQYIGPGSRFA